MSAAPHPLADLATDAGLYPQRLDLSRQSLMFIRMTEAAIRSASFLDDRLLTGGVAQTGGWATIPAVARTLTDAPPLSTPLHFIFHAGHVGSTLVSRLLDEIHGVLSLREPSPLRTLAETFDTINDPDSLLSRGQFNTLTAILIRLWRRGFHDTRAVVVKATSSAGRMGPILLDAAPHARAIYLNLAPEPYLATLLAGENNPIDLRGHGPERFRRLTRFLGAAPGVLHTLSPGELCAMTWLCERLAEDALLRAHSARVMRADFEALLSSPGEWMAAIAAHLALDARADYAARVTSSPALTRYSKATEHAYSPELRAQALADARQHFGEEIHKGLAWLERAGREHAAAGAVLP